MKFSPEMKALAMGPIDQAYLAYAADEQVRSNAASGGVVTALLLHLLETGRIDGAIVTSNVCSGGRIEAKVQLAQTAEQIRAAQTSKYFDVSLIRPAAELIRGFEGKVAVVTLPCHAAALRKLAERDAVLASRLKYVITLFCNHSCHRYLLDQVLLRNHVDQARLESFWFRRGRWRGSMGGRFNDGSEFSFPFKRFSYYHNLHMFSLDRCLHCSDHMGLASDFSAGDAWLAEMKKESIKHSVLFARNGQASGILKEMLDSGRLIGRSVDGQTVFRSQKRAMIYHYNVAARSAAAARWGMKITSPHECPIGWNDYLAAWLIMFNHRWSHSRRWRDLIFRLPRPVVTIYFLLLKFLQNF